MAKVEYIYDGHNLTIQCRENDKLEKIIQSFCAKIQKSKDQLHFIYSGQIISNYNLTFIELANSIDKTRKTMSIIVTDSSNNNDALTLEENRELKEKLNIANKTILEQKQKFKI